MIQFVDKNIIIAPKTAMSMAFKNYLDSTINYNFMGFTDKNKDDSDILPHEKIDTTKTDAYIIVSPNHYRSIYNDALEYIKSDKIHIISIENQCYSVSQTIESSPEDRIEELSRSYDKENLNRFGTCFVSKGFIGGNNKYFYIYCVRNNIPCTIATDNKDQLSALKSQNLPAVYLDSDEGYQTIAKAKYLIFDQGNFTNFYISPFQVSIQLWHGVGLKRMAPQKHITYDYFISTSQWTNDTNFKNIFSAKNFLDYGYPRNDFLLQDGEDSLDLLFCDHELFKLVKEKRFCTTVVYMPTTREYLFGSTSLDKKELLPFDLEELNHQLSTTNTLFIIKLHPFVLRFFDYSPSTKSFSHIRFHTPDGDIYPILKYSDILISDYSSVVYDFMLLDRPIILFDYDRKDYEKNMGGFLFDYDNFSPGQKVQTQKDCMNAIQNTDLRNKNKKIKKLFFTTNAISISDYFIKNIYK